MAIISSRPSVALVKTRWRMKDKPRTPADRAGIIGTNCWKIAAAIYRHLESEGFRFVSDRTVTGVMAEFIAFLVQLVDRAVYGRLPDSDRAVLIGETVRHLARTMENNQRDLFGPGDYRGAFIDLVNARSEEYSHCAYRDEAPDFACLRLFASKVAEIMADGGNRWVVEQMMDIEAPEMVRVVRTLVDRVVPGTGY